MNTDLQDYSHKRLNIPNAIHLLAKLNSSVAIVDHFEGELAERIRRRNLGDRAGGSAKIKATRRRRTHASAAASSVSTNSGNRITTRTISHPGKA